MDGGVNNEQVSASRVTLTRARLLGYICCMPCWRCMVTCNCSAIPMPLVSCLAPIMRD